MGWLLRQTNWWSVRWGQGIMCPTNLNDSTMWYILYFPFFFHSKIVRCSFLQKHLRIWSVFPRASLNPLTSESSPVKCLLPHHHFQWSLLQLSHRPDIVCQWICVCFELSSSITLITFTKLCIFYEICHFICSPLALGCPMLATEIDKG